MPDLFRGTPLFKDHWFSKGTISYFLNLPYFLWANQTRRKAEYVERDLVEVVQANIVAQQKTVSNKNTSVGCLGFCYGGWMVGKAMSISNNIFSTGVAVHPSWIVETVVRGGLSSDLALAERILENDDEKRILFLPAKQDEGTKPSSPVVQALAAAHNQTSNDISVVFEDMDHGFVTRGNRSDPQVCRRQDEAMDRAVAFFQEHLFA